MAKRRGSGRPTVNDVARRAGVSAITVSRAMRTPAQVSEELRERIEAAIRALDYVPDSKARALASGRTHVIGILVPSLTNFVFADTLRGAQDAVQDTDYQIQIGNTRYSGEEEDRLISLFLGQRPAALIVTGLDQSSAARRLLRKSRLPVVQIMDVAPDPIDMAVGFAHDAAAEAAVAHLLDNGYRRIGFIGARMDPRIKRRLAGFRRALESRSLHDPAREIFTEEVSSVRHGRQMLCRMLAAAPDCDAVFCVNDDLALGALFECQARSIAVPEQMGIIGFNDLEMMEAAEPSVTSIRTRRYEIGRRAVEMVLTRLENRPVVQKVVDLGFELIPRRSTQGTASTGPRSSAPRISAEEKG